MTSRSKANSFVWGMALIVLGLVLITQHLRFRDLFDFLIDYWPVLLILWGVWFMLRSKEGAEKEALPGDEADFKPAGVPGDLHQHSTFGDLRLSLEGRRQLSGEASTILGGIKIHGEKLEMAAGEHLLRLNVTVGDIRVDLPSDLPVKVTAQVSLGDIRVFEKKQSGFSQRLSYQTPNYAVAAAKLHLICNVGLGDIKVY